jgi:hypothetical protein
MHIRDFEATTSSMVAELSAGVADGAPDGAPGRAWIALGNPCASVFVPVLVPSPSALLGSVPGALAHEVWARRFAALARAAETDVATLESVRGVLGPLEAELWDGAEALDPRDTDPARWRSFASEAERRVQGALDTLAGAGIGVVA